MANNREPLYRTWTVALGFPGLTFATGIAVMPFHFWLGVVVAYVGTFWFLVDWGFVSSNEPRLSRMAISLLPLAAAMLITWIAFRPAPLEVQLLAVDANYADGTILTGIKWKSRYSDMRVSLRNDSSTQYFNIVATLRTNLLIVGVGSVNPITQCQASPHMPGLTINAATLKFPTANGQQSIPLFVPETGPTAATQYKISCDKIIPGENLELVIALEPGIVAGKKWERRLPSWASINVDYDAFFRPNSERFSKCFSEKCERVENVAE